MLAHESAEISVLDLPMPSTQTEAVDWPFEPADTKFTKTKRLPQRETDTEVPVSYFCLQEQAP